MSLYDQESQDKKSAFTILISVFVHGSVVMGLALLPQAGLVVLPESEIMANEVSFDALETPPPQGEVAVQPEPAKVEAPPAPAQEAIKELPVKPIAVEKAAPKKKAPSVPTQTQQKKVAKVLPVKNEPAPAVETPIEAQDLTPVETSEESVTVAAASEVPPTSEMPVEEALAQSTEAPVEAPPVAVAEEAPSSPAVEGTAPALEPAAVPAVAQESSLPQGIPGVAQGATSYLNLRQKVGNRPPAYPAESRFQREEGTVVLTYSVSNLGEVENINIAQSSGYERLDEAALKAVSQFKYLKGQASGQVVHPIKFSLRGEAEQAPSRLRRNAKKSAAL